jgi:large subunit ribosomal protein L21
MYAVIKTGGKQYRVEPGQTLQIEKIEAGPGAEIVFEEVLMIVGGEVKVGAPTIPGARVKAVVMGQDKGPKLVLYKYKRRKGYHKKQGHRQKLTTVRIGEVVAA